jgi:hypothetical protein
MPTRPYRRCELCRNAALLCDSHLVPAALFRLCMAHQDKNLNPLAVTEKRSFRTSKQWSQYLLCEDCEKRFRENGEDWVLRQCCRSITGRPFRLREILAKHEAPVQVGENFAFSCGRMPEIDVDKLIYFGVSVFWRAAVRAWRLHGVVVGPLGFGPYTEQLRCFLLQHGPFPENAALSLWVSTVPRPLLGFPTPLSTATNHHLFYIPGLGFELTLGTRIPEHAKRTALSGPGRAIILSATFEKKLLQGMAAAFGPALSQSRP